MKEKLILLLICLISHALCGQEKVEITGQIKDEQTKNVLEFCSIAAYNLKDSLITGGVTDNKGFFTIPLDRGNYHFIISYIGYIKDTTKTIDVYENKFLGIIKLVPDAKFLKEVTVSTNSAENQLDRDVQIVTDKLKAGTSSAKQVLEKVNGVSYDRYNNSIKVDNDSKIIILVDGMEKDQEYIKNLSPDRLKKIEVIRDPGGRYGLEGYSAVINIILKKDYRGTELFINDNTLQDVDASKTEYIPVQNNLNATVNYVYNKINVYASYNNSYNSFNFQSHVKKEYNNGLVIENHPVDNKAMNMHIKQLYNNYTLGADYYLNPKHTISFESDLSTQPMKYNTSNELNTIIFSTNGIPLANYNSQVSGTSGNVNSSSSLFYIGKLDENNVINSNFTYSVYNNKYTSTYKDDLLFNLNESGADTKNSTKFYLEYTHTFKNKTNLQIGYGNTWQKQDNEHTADSISSRFVYTDIRHKLYAYYSWQKSKKLGIKIGAAAETSSPDANGIKHSYIILQPYADIKYTPSEKISFKLKYRAENNYPTIDQSNPFTIFTDKQSVKTGNPYLKPELTHKISLQTDILGGFVTIEPYYHFSDNLITETGVMRSDNIFETSYTNIGNYSKYGTEARFSLPLKKGFYIESSVDVFNNSIRYAGKTNEFNFWTMSSQLIYQNEKKATVAGLKYEKNLVKYITAQGYQKGNNDFWILFVQQPFFKQKLTIMVLYFIPTNFGVDFNQGSYIKTDTYKENKSYDISILKNIVMFELSYRFNKGKSANKTEKNMEEDNEKTKKGIF